MGAPSRSGRIPIVALAGAPDALREFLAAHPANTGPGMAFILLQHGDPAPSGPMAALLQPHTSVRVHEAADGAAIKADHAYLVPPGAWPAIVHGQLRLSGQSGPHGAPFDAFLASLAAAWGPGTACVVLSGRGGLGSHGLEVISRSGGLLIVQDPEEAALKDMPLAAAATGLADAILPIRDVPGTLARHFREGRGSDPRPAGPEVVGSEAAAEPEAENLFDAIMALARERTSRRFDLYKRGTLERRLTHRMVSVGLSDRAEYLWLLRARPEEVKALHDSLLVGVTQFFRDPPAFEALARQIGTDLVPNRRPGRPLRVWVPGCSTGEEAYSVAMLLLEALAAGGAPPAVQVFASDVNRDAVAFARRALYPASIGAHVPPDRLEAFFTREEGGYRVRRHLRDAVTFAVQDVLVDPPFQPMDLVSCRNLLVYLQPEAQRRALWSFRTALREGGLLLLGGSETVGEEHGFAAISGPHRLYRHVAAGRPATLAPLAAAQDGGPDGGQHGAQAGAPSAIAPAGPLRDSVELARDTLVAAFVPASVLIDETNACLHVFGPTDRYLTVPAGAVSLDVAALLRPGLRAASRIAIEAARLGVIAQVTGPLAVEGEDGTALVEVAVRPVRAGNRRLLLLSFLERAEPSVSGDTAEETAALRQRIETLTDALAQALDRADDAVRAQRLSSEEALSLSEEVQSTADELVTSRRELVALNEELAASNGQLRDSLDRQRATLDELRTVLDSLGTAVMLLDANLHIRLFSATAARLFRVRDSDVGRPLADLAPTLDDTDLVADTRAVLARGQTIEREVGDQAGTWYSRRVLPYRTQPDRVEGVVVTIADVTAQRRAAQALAEGRQSAEQANLGKSRLLAAASHDLRQPLQTIRLLRGLIGQKVAGEDVENLLNRLDAVVAIMSGTLSTLLDIRQIEAGVLHPAVHTLPMRDILKRLREEYADHMAERDLAWRVVDCSLAVRSDQQLLLEIMRNLLSNALRYTARGRVLLGCRRRGAMLRLEVWDTGIGIVQAATNRIFEEFHRLEEAGHDGEHGSGLGLAIVQRLASLLGHRVEVRSTPERGSVFSIEVPIDRTVPAPLLPMPDLHLPRAPYKNRLILLVEDEPTLRHLLASLLSNQGYRVLPVAGAAEALDMAASPDLVVADLESAGAAGGPDLTAALRLRAGRTIPAILLTGTVSGEALRVLKAPDCLYFDKPVEAQALLAGIETLLAASAGPAAAPTEPEVPVQPAHGAVFIVDDDEALLHALRDTLRQAGFVVRTFASAEAFLAIGRTRRQGVALIDVRLPGLGGLDLVERLRPERHTLGTIVMTAHGDTATAVRALRAGALDYVEKPFAAEELLASLSRATRQDDEHPSDLRREAAAKLSRLTKRQHDILDRVLAGQPNKNIAADLAISQRTVENHRAAIMRKTGSRSLSSLVHLVLTAR